MASSEPARSDTTEGLEQPPAVSTPPALLIAFLLAFVPPTMLAWNVPPSATLLNQALALLGWASVIMAVARHLRDSRPSLDRSRPPAVAYAAPLVLLLMAGAAISEPMRRGLPWSLALSGAGVCLVALTVLAGGAACRGGALRVQAFRAFCIALMVAGVASALVGAIQFFVPQWADGDWIARTGFEGRAVGNLRQPNHLSTLLLWAAAAAWWLGQARVVPAAAAGALYAVMLAGVVMTASRTGMVGVLLFAVWGLMERRARWPGRVMLVAAPVVYGLVWWALSAWAHASGHVFGAEGRMTADGDLSSSRFAIWADTLALIARQPIDGVGFGRFNFAWSLTPFPHRPVAFFDHTHNLPLQLAVELGLPAATLMTGLLLWLLFAAWHLSLRRVGEDVAEGHGGRVAFVMVLLVALHSQLEYPLWYAHFLLPTAWLCGWIFAVGRGRRSSLARPEPGSSTLAAAPPPLPVRRPYGFAAGASAASSKSSTAAPALPRLARVAGGTALAANGGWAGPALLVAGLVLMIGGASVVFDYQRVVAIFAPSAAAAPLEERIAAGRRSWFFAHHAAYAAVTTAEHPGAMEDDFKLATYYLLDTRLMTAWARAKAEQGDLERARHLAARLREFRNPASDEFFAPCEARPRPRPLPFQCVAPTKTLDDRDFD